MMIFEYVNEGVFVNIKKFDKPYVGSWIILVVENILLYNDDGIFKFKFRSIKLVCKIAFGTMSCVFGYVFNTSFITLQDKVFWTFEYNEYVVTLIFDKYVYPTNVISFDNCISFVKYISLFVRYCELHVTYKLFFNECIDVSTSFEVV